MGANSNDQRVSQEFKYIKIPDRRLISGLLYVNVINHNDNDGSDDFNQELSDASSVSDGIKYSNSFSEDGSAFTSFQDRGRIGMRHTFADYDCFVFHVAGGMSLTGGIAAPTTAIQTWDTLGELQSNGFASGTNWVDGSGAIPVADRTKDWVTLNNDSGENPYGDYCSHFVKYHLLSRINNASGHGLYQNSRPNFWKSRPIHRQTYVSPSTPLFNVPTQANVTNEYVLSHGIYDDKDTLGEELGTQSYATLGHGSSEPFTRIDSSIRGTGETQAADGALTDADGNTYYSPVDTIKIYGKHHLVFESHATSGSAGDGSFRRVYSYTSSNAAHITTFWDLVIDIGLRGNNPQAATATGAAEQTGASDKANVRPQINVSFQPFGETADFSISDSEHTS